MTIPETAKPQTSALPTIKYLVQTYGSTTTEQKKVAEVFKRYESSEKVKRLQFELSLIKDGKVADDLCDLVIGKRLSAPSGGYKNWAGKMLIFLAAAKQ